MDMRDMEHWIAREQRDEWIVTYAVPEDEQQINRLSGVEAHIRAVDGAVVKCAEAMLVS